MAGLMAMADQPDYLPDLLFTLGPAAYAIRTARAAAHKRRLTRPLSLSAAGSGSSCPPRFDTSSSTISDSETTSAGAYPPADLLGDVLSPVPYSSLHRCNGEGSSTLCTVGAYARGVVSCWVAWMWQTAALHGMGLPPSTSIGIALRWSSVQRDTGSSAACPQPGRIRENVLCRSC